MATFCAGIGDDEDDGFVGLVRRSEPVVTKVTLPYCFVFFVATL